jgi:predicted nucleotidyltransferase
MNALAKVLSSQIRAGIFEILFGLRDRPAHMREIERLSGFAIGTIQQDLKKLEALDLVTRRKDGNRVYYEANKRHPLYPEIRKMVLKTVGLADVLKKALEKNPDIRVAFVYGSIARGEEKAASDLDLMVVGDLGLRKLTALLAGTSERIGREVNPHSLLPSEFRRRKKEGDHFLTSVLREPKLFIIGGEDELEAVGR